jgi:magnesium-transporting ATPase (P-type)
MLWCQHSVLDACLLKIICLQTGTITADTQSVSKLIPSLSDATDEQLEKFQLAQLAGCHSLIHLDDSATPGASDHVVGDPLDQAAFDFSGWKYNRTSECYERPDLENVTLAEPVRLWQLKCFPFDASKRLSTAVVVMETGGGSLRLLSLTKGSPDTIRSMCISRVDSDFMSRFNGQLAEFETQGYRSIALGWKDFSGTGCCATIFPNGIQKGDIGEARRRGSSLHRKDFEVDELHFGGFVQFDASIRPSSRRIIEELNAGGINSIMLTGDAVDAAVTVARQVGLIKPRRVAILEEKTDGSKSFHWRLVKWRREKKDRAKHWSATSENIPFSSSSLKDLLKQEQLGKVAFATTGGVLEMFFEHDEIAGEAQDFLDNLPRVSVIARATPKQKKLVISHLRQYGERTVMMCGESL